MPRFDARQTDPPSPPLPERIAIVGIGQMGLCCASVLAGAAGESTARRITLWGHDEAECGALSQTRTSDRLPHYRLPDAARVSLSDAEALDGAELIVSAIPVQHLESAWARLRKYTPPGVGVVSVSKGVETTTLRRPTQVIAAALGDDPDAAPRPLGVLSGPTIAAELAQGLPATMITASDHPGFAELIQRVFSTNFLRTYTSTDLLGVEIAGATKNVIAIAAGILDGLNAGYNAKSALLARGMAEIARLGSAMGASRQTFFGIAGAGDLATTCFSPEGRNRSCGEALGKGESLGDYLARSRFVVEGVETTRAVLELARKYNAEMPITEAVHAVLFENLDPIEGIAGLMSRELREETLGR